MHVQLRAGDWIGNLDGLKAIVRHGIVIMGVGPVTLIVSLLAGVDPVKAVVIALVGACGGAAASWVARKIR